jgi:O-antigen ligase
MNLSSLKYKANYYVLILLVFVIPLERRLAPPLIILMLLTSLFNNKFKQLPQKKVLLFIMIYFLYGIGVFYSSNFDYGINDLIGKLSLLVFPLIVFITNINFKEKLTSILTSFVEGCFVSGIISLIVSAVNYYYTLDSSWFFYGNSSVFLHSSYFAMYASFAILILYSFIFKATIHDKKSVVISLIQVLFFSLLIVFSSSKAGLLSLVFIHIGAISYWIIKSRSYLLGGGVFMLFFTILFLFYFQSATIKNRVDEVFAVATSGDTSSGSTTAARIDIWEVSIDLIKDKPFFGYGTGDVKTVLVERYKEEGLNVFADKKLNTHNQFLQTSIAIGLIGGLVLILMLVFPLYLSISRKVHLYTFFILLVILNLLTESMLERQMGVVFYGFFNSLFFIIYFNEKRMKEDVLKD